MNFLIARTIDYNNSKLKLNAKIAKAEINKSNKDKSKKNDKKSNSNLNSIVTKFQNTSSTIMSDSKKNSFKNKHKKKQQQSFALSNLFIYTITNSNVDYSVFVAVKKNRN